MSEYEHIKGLIKLIPQLENEDMEAYFQRATGIKVEPEGFYDNIYDLIWDYDLSEKFIIIDGSIYKFLKYKDIDEFNYCDVEAMGNGEYCFSACFYNGGTCLSEVLEDAIKEHKRLEARA